MVDLFGIKSKRKVAAQQKVINNLSERILKAEAEFKEYKHHMHENHPKASMADLMRESLGLHIDFSAADVDTCQPPNLFAGMKEDERKVFISEMETIHSNEKFQKLVRYMINIFSMKIVYGDGADLQRNGQIAVVAFRTFLKKLDDMHLEFLSYKPTDDDDFDEHGVLPE